MYFVMSMYKFWARRKILCITNDYISHVDMIFISGLTAGGKCVSQVYISHVEMVFISALTARGKYVSSVYVYRFDIITAGDLCL